MQLRTFKSAFTLIELLLSIGIIGVLAGIVITAINPSKQFVDAEDSKRLSYAKEVKNALFQYSIDNNGFPTGIPTGEANALPICSVGSGSGCVNLDVLVTGAKYLLTLERDSAETKTYHTGYSIYKTEGGFVTVTPQYLGYSPVNNTSNSCENCLVSHWTLNDGVSTTAIDAQRRSNATLVNMSSNDWVTDAPTLSYTNSYSLDFDGVDDYVEIASSSNFDTQDSTWCIWFNTDGTFGAGGGTSNTLLFGRHDVVNSQNGILMDIWTNGRIIWEAKHSSGRSFEILSVTGYNDSAWHHVCGVAASNGNTAYLYIDGALIGQDIADADWAFDNQVIRMGDPIDAFWGQYKGKLDDFRVYNYALTAQQIAQLAAGNL